MASILVVDDIESNLKLIERWLLRDKHTITTSLSGEEALTLLESNSFDVVLLDIEMPRMNGIETLKKIKQSPQTMHNTVMMLTAHSEMSMVKECLQLGAVDYCLKPLDIPDFKQKISNLLNN